ncbi:MAG: universal stress protein [Methanomassiliicoccales archaeon]|nr:universal stress protein [Methanomassiliicoccales archaeon]NYT15312.1 universal stress protein [Methanomassiliicoccales archaeon]
MEIKKILVGVDGSENSLRAVEFASEIATRFNASVTLLLAIAPSDAVLFSGKDTYLPESEGIHQIRLRNAKNILNEKGVAMEERVELEHPAQALIEASKDFDLVVVGCRGLSGIKGFLMGSVSSKVVHHCKRPVMVVP